MLGYNPVMRTLKKIILFIIPALVCVLAFLWFYKPKVVTVFFQNPDYSRSLYKQARELQLNNGFKAAYYTYGRISPKYRAYDAVLFQQAKCSAGIEDEKTAIKKYEKLIKSKPESPLVPLANYNLGRAFIRYNQPAMAEKQFLYVLKNYPGTDYAMGSFYYLGELNKNKDKELSAQYMLKYIALAPGGSFALNCYDGLKSLNYRFNEKDIKHAGIALFMQQKYEKALEYLGQLPESETWYYRAFSHKALGNGTTAFNLFKKALNSYIDPSTNGSKVRRAMEAYVELSPESRYRSWTNILNRTHRARDFALYRKAQLMSLKKSKKMYEEIFEKYPHGNYASEALWSLFWYEYDSGDYKQAIELAQKHISTYENTKATPRIHFWLGKIYEAKNEPEKAKKFYNAVLLKFPDSYYALRATGRLSALNGGNDGKWGTNTGNKLPPGDLQVQMPYSYRELEQRHGPGAAEMILAGDYETAMLFIKDDPFLDSWIKFRKEVVMSSIVTARNAMAGILSRPVPSDPRWKLIYPVYYSGEINRNAVLNNLDPVLVLALLKEESHFNPYAVSSSGALGLMQVLPSTARDIVRWKKLGNHYSKELFNPEINIRVGAAYLGHTRDVFEGNMLFSVAAYNCGPAAVSGWLKKLPTADADRFIENIPYNQTRDYVKKVFGSYWNYKRVYGFD